MDPLKALFWASAACVAYTYALYPLAVAVASRLRGRPVRRAEGRASGPVSLVVSAYNEASSIGRRVDELAGLVAGLPGAGEVIVVSDGSTDGTAEAARRHGRGLVRVIDRAENRGKAASLTEGCEAARYSIVAFADARQTWAPDALERLLENFADPTIGAVSGELVLESAPGVMAGVGLYWRFETWLRSAESRLHSTVGLTGAICAVRRGLFRPIPPGTVLDDVYWPIRVVMQGYRVVLDGRAKAFDRLPEHPRDEFRRKVRTLSGVYQLVARLPSVLLPWRDPVWVQFVSHKLLRLAVPWALIGLLAASVVIVGSGGGFFYQAALAAQVAGYALGVAGACTPVGRRLKLASAAGSFLVLNAAAWLAFWTWARGRAGRSWRKVAYEPRPAVSLQAEPVGDGGGR